MNKNEVSAHLNKLVGFEYTDIQMYEKTELQLLRFKMQAICKVYRAIRPIIIFIKPFLKLKKWLALSAEAFILLMDSECPVTPKD